MLNVTELINIGLATSIIIQHISKKCSRADWFWHVYKHHYTNTILKKCSRTDRFWHGYKHHCTNTILRNVAELIDLAWLQASLYKNISMKGSRTHLFWHGFKHHIPMKCTRSDWFWHGYKHHYTNTFLWNVAELNYFGIVTSITIQTHF